MAFNLESENLKYFNAQTPEETGQVFSGSAPGRERVAESAREFRAKLNIFLRRFFCCPCYSNLCNLICRRLLKETIFRLRA